MSPSLAYLLVYMAIFVDYVVRLDSLEVGTPFVHEECLDVHYVMKPDAGDRDQSDIILKTKQSCEHQISYRNNRGNGLLLMLHTGIIGWITAAGLLMYLIVRCALPTPYLVYWNWLHYALCFLVCSVAGSGVLLRWMERDIGILTLTHHLKLMALFVDLLNEPLRRWFYSG